MRDRRKPGENRRGRVPARERNPESIAFADRLVRLFKNEVHRVDDEIFRSYHLRLRFHPPITTTDNRTMP